MEHKRILPECIEKFKGISENIQEIKEQLLNHIPTQIRELDIKIENIPVEIEKKFVSQEQFRPVQKIVYGMVGAILLAAVWAFIDLVLK